MVGTGESALVNGGMSVLVDDADGASVDNGILVPFLVDNTGGADGTKLFDNEIADNADGAKVDDGILVPMMVDDADGATADDGILVDDVVGASVDEGSVGNADGALVDGGISGGGGEHEVLVLMSVSR